VTLSERAVRFACRFVTKVEHILVVTGTVGTIDVAGKKRKDGAPSVEMVHAKIVKCGPPAAEFLQTKCGWAPGLNDAYSLLVRNAPSTSSSSRGSACSPIALQRATARGLPAGTGQYP
jgi:hypothetical protein